MNTSEKRVLIVDDSTPNIQVLGLILVKAGYKVTVANNGMQALQALEKETPDIILSDIQMPEMDGFTFCREVKKKETFKDIPFLFLTASNKPEDETKGLEMGAVDFITKPINPPVIIARVKTHLQLREALFELTEKYRLVKENEKLRDDVERISRHDLKGPLQGVLAIPQLLKMDTNITEEQVKLLDVIEESALTILNMINSSLDMYKMEVGTYEVDRKPVNIIEIIFRIITLSKYRKSKNIEISVTLNNQLIESSDSSILRTDEMLFFSLMSNILKNAIEASPHDSNIDIFITEGEPFLIEVTNQGSVPESIRENFFDKYVTSNKKSGTGLGTYSVKLIGKTLGGDVKLNSDVPDRTTISITLPDLKDLKEQ